MAKLNKLQKILRLIQEASILLDALNSKESQDVSSPNVPNPSSITKSKRLPRLIKKQRDLTEDELS